MSAARENSRKRLLTGLGGVEISWVGTALAVGRVARSFGALAAFVLLWEVLVKTGVLDQAFFPPPTTVFPTLGRLIQSGEIPNGLVISLQRIAIGFLVGAGAGVILGLSMGCFRFVYGVLDPLVAFTQPVPKLAVLPVLLVLLGLGSRPIEAMAAILCFYPTLLNTIAGVRNVDPILIEVVRNFGGNRLQVVWKVVLPGALPTMYAGFRLGLAFAFEGELAAEFVAATTGIGAQTWQYWQIYRIDRMYANLIVIACAGLLLTYALRKTEKILIRWR